MATPARPIFLAHLTVPDTTPPELLNALPAGVPLAIEAPCGALADLRAVERARRAYQALSALLSANTSGQQTEGIGD